MIDFNFDAITIHRNEADCFFVTEKTIFRIHNSTLCTLDDKKTFSHQLKIKDYSIEEIE